MSDGRHGKRTGWLLDSTERAALLARFPPRYPTVVAEHVTLPTPDSEELPPLPAPTRGWVVGRADDAAGVEAMVVAIGGSTTRVDGGTWHVTWSLAEGRRAKESNDVLAARGWTPVEPVGIVLRPGRW